MSWFKRNWTWIASALTGLPIMAFRDSFTDKNGMNEVDREYMALLKRQVENGETTLDDVREKLRSKWKGDGEFDSWFDSAYNDVDIRQGDPLGNEKTLNPGGTSNGASGLFGVLDSLVAYFTRNQLTGAEREQNAFNASEAQISRDFTEYMARNKYSMETQSMQDAGVNPAMVYGGGNLVPTAANGAAASGSPIGGGSVADLLATLVRMPLELKSMQAEIARSKADAERSKQEGNAAMMNAETNRQNAETAARQAGAAERQATVAEMRQQVDAAMAESNMSVNEATVTHIAKQCSILEKQLSQMDEILDIQKRQVSAQEKQALASLKQAAAAVQNAATNDYLSNYQSSLLWAQELLTWSEGEGRDIINKYLDEGEKQRLENLRKEGIKLDAEGRLIDKEGKLATAKMIREYVNCGTDVFNTVSRFTGININTPGFSGSLAQSAPYAGYTVNPTGLGTAYEY